ncbi:type I polyketide synthase [Micromonospora sp. SL1-18]|uniref:type I polyketide synthase n=1 Tax=Micromonospora sp. SL1-18 TaxID=3399128 RepID=UPI003A4E2FEC
MQPYGIAVIGMACRLPQSPHPDAFWQLLRSGGNAITEPPAGRRSAGTRPGGFLERVDLFDAGFFAVSPRAAAAMDPQQRLMLELSWEALEDAGIDPGRLRGSRTAVVMGAIWDDYATLTLRPGATVDTHTLAGLHRSLIANRTSYALGLRGPSLTVDTGQSSSLVAVHLACESLRTGDATLAIAGGVNLALAAESTLQAERFGALSPDHRCFTFDARANGYVRGEGGGLVVLKPLRQAIADGDPVYCVIRGSAVNNDGRTESLTVPSADAQQEVIRLACARAGVDPADVQHVEVHGSGTKVGDPIEAAALGATYGIARRDGSPLRVGSAKTNVGHLEAAAGITGLLKMALSIRHRQIPPSLNFAAPHPRIPLDVLNLRVQTTLGSWPRPDGALLGGVSSFGMGGTNCHVVLADAPQPPRGAVTAATRIPERDREPVPWVVSATTVSALRAQAARLHAHLADRPELSPVDVGHTLAVGRSAFAHRAVVLARTRLELLAGLDRIAGDEPAEHVVRGTASEPAGTVFVFPGHAPPAPEATLHLLESSDVIARRLDECDRALLPLTGWSVLDVLRAAPDAPPLDRPDVLPPVRFAVLVALAEHWRAYGVEPDAVAGHGHGEVAAACVAGILSLQDAARVITALAGQHGTDGRPEQLLATLARITPRSSAIAFRSAVTGAQVDADRLDAGYWHRGPHQPVGTGASTAALLSRGCRRVIEMDPRRLPAALAEAYVSGAPVRWEHAFAGCQPQRVHLPTYPFERQRYWLEQDASPAVAPDAGTVGTPPAGGLADLPSAARPRALLDLVRRHAAAVLGYGSPDDVPADRPFQAAGLDSMGALELGNRIGAATGVELPDTLLFDHPTPAAVAGYLHDRIRDDTASSGGPPAADLDRMEAELLAIEDAGRRANVAARLRDLAWRLAGRSGGTQADDFATATDEQLFAALDHAPSTRWVGHGR